MQYRTLFDIQQALPHCAGSLLDPMAILLLGLWLRSRLGRNFPQTPRNWQAILYGTLEVLQRGWKWIAGAGAVFLLMALLQAWQDYRNILALRNASNTFVIEGKVQSIELWYSFWTSRSARYGNEALTVNGYRFEYRENVPGSPYPLSRGTRAVKPGMPVRIVTDGRYLLRVEGPLCMIYARCQVWEILGLRYEQDMS